MDVLTALAAALVPLTGQSLVAPPQVEEVAIPGSLALYDAEVDTIQIDRDAVSAWLARRGAPPALVEPTLTCLLAHELVHALQVRALGPAASAWEITLREAHAGVAGAAACTALGEGEASRFLEASRDIPRAERQATAWLRARGWEEQWSALTSPPLPETVVLAAPGSRPLQRFAAATPLFEDAVWRWDILDVHPARTLLPHAVPTDSITRGWVVVGEREHGRRTMTVAVTEDAAGLVAGVRTGAVAPRPFRQRGARDGVHLRDAEGERWWIALDGVLVMIEAEGDRLSARRVRLAAKTAAVVARDEGALRGT